MAGRKGKTETIEHLGSMEKLTVQKSQPLYSLWRSDLTLPEFKILDTYLARIDSHNPEKRTVTFEKGELEEKLGVNRIQNQDLKDRLKHLMGNVVEVADSDYKRGFRLVTLFETAEAEQDEDGLWTVRLECTQKAMKYFFNIENLGYMRYKLRCIMPLTSRYTYVMFNYLENNRFRKAWDVSLEKLKEILHCEDEVTYTTYKYFNDKLLKRIQKEMHEKTECRYTYTPVKKGRKVVAVHFELETLKDLDAPVLTEETVETVAAAEPRIECKWQDALSPLGLTAEKIAEIGVLADAVTSGSEADKYKYLAAKVAELMRYDKKKPIRDKAAYIRKMIMQDTQPAAAKTTRSEAKKNEFCEFDQRDYNYDELESQLLNQN